MDISFATVALRTLCHDEAAALCELDELTFEKLRARLDDLDAVPTLSDAFKLPGRLRRPGKRDRYVLTLTAGTLLALEPADDPLPRRANGEIDLKQVTAVRVLSIGRDHV